MEMFEKLELEDHIVTGAIIENEGKFAIVKHSECEYMTLPLKVTDMKDFLDIVTLEVELEERLNIKVHASDLVCVKNEIVDRNGKRVYIKYHIYEIEQYTGDIKSNDLMWLTIDEMKAFDYIDIPTKLLIEYIVSK